MRLLLAEDEKPLSRAVAAILQRSHYTVDAVYDGDVYKRQVLIAPTILSLSRKSRR